MTIAPCTPSLGSRVSVSGETGTVRWIGSLPGLKEPRIGVEYDVSREGRHDGSYQEERVFEAAVGCGAFVKVSKVDIGVSLAQAIEQRYTKAAVEDLVDMKLDNGREMEMVGFEKVKERQAHLERLDVAMLDHQGISHPSPSSLLSLPLLSLQRLNLDFNLLSLSSHIYDICSSIPSLLQLSLSFNKLQVSQEKEEFMCVFPETKQRFYSDSNLRTLVMNGSGLEGVEGVIIAKKFKKLRELHLGGNGEKGFKKSFLDFLRIYKNEKVEEELKKYSDFENDEFHFLDFFLKKHSKFFFPENLEIFCLDDNKIEKWEEIDFLPPLLHLQVKKNRLGTFPLINFLETSKKYEKSMKKMEGIVEEKEEEDYFSDFFLENYFFNFLENLSIAENNFSDFSDLYCLSKICKNLKSLNISSNPFYSEHEHIMRPLLTTLFPSLLLLNSSSISKKQREIAESYFLTAIKSRFPEILKKVDPKSEVLQKLEKKYGEMVTVDEGQSEKIILKNFLVKVRIHGIGLPIEKKVPLSMTWGNLRNLVKKIVKWEQNFGSQRMVLRFGDVDSSGRQEVGEEEEERDLGFLGISQEVDVFVDVEE